MIWRLRQQRVVVVLECWHSIYTNITMRGGDKYRHTDKAQQTAETQQASWHPAAVDRRNPNHLIDTQNTPHSTHPLTTAAAAAAAASQTLTNIVQQTQRSVVAEVLQSENARKVTKCNVKRVAECIMQAIATDDTVAWCPSLGCAVQKWFKVLLVLETSENPSNSELDEGRSTLTHTRRHTHGSKTEAGVH